MVAVGSEPLTQYEAVRRVLREHGVALNNKGAVVTVSFDDSTIMAIPSSTAAGVPAGPVNDVAGAFGLAERLGLDPIVTLHRQDGTTVRLTRNPISLSRTPPRYNSAAASPKHRGHDCRPRRPR